MSGMPKRRLFKMLRKLNGGPPVTSKEERKVTEKMTAHGKPDYPKYEETVKKFLIEARKEITKEEAV